MLIELLNEVIADVNRLDVEESAPAMLREIRRSRPDFLTGLDVPTDQIDRIGRLIATGVVNRVKELPPIIHRLFEALDQGYDPGTRCAVATSLAYVAQPRDLVPDDAPGGYGYIDDYILARAALIEFSTDIDDGTDVSHQSLKLMAELLPPPVVPQIQQAVDDLSTLYQMMRAMPPFVVDAITAQIVVNPLAVAQGPTRSPGAFHAPPNVTGGFFGQSSTYVDGNNIIVPGVGGVYHGQLVIL